MEPVVMVAVHQILCAGNDWFFAVAEPQAVNNQGIPPGNRKKERKIISLSPMYFHGPTIF